MSGPEVERFFCEIVPVSLGETNGGGGGPIELTTELTDMEDGAYELAYSVPVKGTYELAVRLFGEHIQGSPFKVNNLQEYVFQVFK